MRSLRVAIKKEKEKEKKYKPNPYIDSPPRPVPVGSPPWITKSFIEYKD